MENRLGNAIQVLALILIKRRLEHSRFHSDDLAQTKQSFTVQLEQ